ncbi:hypothetical protein ACLBX9_12235 [Methylobacterium sp. A49B]
MLMADSATLLAHHATVSPPPGARTVPRLSGKLVPSVPQGRAAEGDPIGDLIRDLDLGRSS